MQSGRVEVSPAGALDTVRSLHQTVVSLRTALEAAKLELKELKQKYQQNSPRDYADVIEKLTLENHVLRRRIIDSGLSDDARNIKLEATYSPRDVIGKVAFVDEVVIKTPTPDINSEFIEVNESSQSEEGDKSSTSVEEFDLKLEEKLQNVEVSTDESSVSSVRAETVKDQSEISVSKDIKHKDEGFKTKLELLSKFDVRIKVRTLKDGVITSTTTSETDSTETEKEKQRKDDPDNIEVEERREHFENTSFKGTSVSLKTVSAENIKMAVPNETDSKKPDKFDVQVRITSEENLVVKDTVERNRQKDILNLDVDDLSFRSMSEGDNSVFSDSGVAPPAAPDRPDESDESEEVDDIELIFTTDESKDMSNLQEDLVSIRDNEWGPSPISTTHSTPVLIKFHTLDPDFQPGQNLEKENNSAKSFETLRQKRVSLPSDKEFRSGKSLDLPGRGILKSCDNRSDNLLYKRSPNTSTRRLDSVDSLTCEYNRGLSFDNTKSSSFELGSSMDILQRGSSDSFKNYHLGHRFSVFAETDISKCGISEDDLGNLNVRRNTCPNPFQYRPPPYRGFSRQPGPFKGVHTQPRPILRDSGAARRDGAAQTDVSALPDRWRSESHLAHKMSLPPQVSVLACPPRPPPRRVAPQHHSKRQLLSDIGFTSQVPELSRSADPLWELEQRGAAPPHACLCPPPPNTCKYMARGAYRSPCLSRDRSREWVPPNFTANKGWLRSLPDVRGDDTDELLEETESYLRRSADNLRYDHCPEEEMLPLGRPYIPAEPKNLRLGHAVKLITPQGRVAVGRVRYVGLCGDTAATSSVMVGAVLAGTNRAPHNDGTHRGRRYFLAPANTTALFVPFSKVVMAWAN